MKLRRLELRGFQQFQRLVLDFTNPDTDEPADKVCFIGRNGTGKSTLLRVLHQLLMVFFDRRQGIAHGDGLAEVELETGGDRYHLPWRQETRMPGTGRLPLLSPSIDRVEGWRKHFFEDFENTFGRGKYREYEVPDDDVPRLGRADGLTDLLVYSPAEVMNNRAMDVRDVPHSNVGQALAMGQRFPFRHEVSRATVSGMWQTLLYLVLKREQDRQAFESRAENLDKTKRDLMSEFERAHPEPLSGLARLWNKILAPADLELDVANAVIPVLATDNLKLYVRHKSTGHRIAYNQLSTGIRDFLFRIGHLFLLYFNRRVERGFVLVDEPENSLFPDFLFQLMEVYDDIVRNDDGTTGTQIFMATHSPIVAAQFQPFERVILEWDGAGGVTAKKGVAPVGDDPNDVLEQDFELTHLMGKEGQKMWQRYLDLKRQARRSTDYEAQKKLVEEASDIASRYRFGSDKP